jgi:hypothetical protein
MHGVTTTQECGGLARVVHVLHAHCAVLLQLALHARMGTFHLDREATLARLAMEEVVPTTNTTNAAPFAVENFLPLPVIVEKYADVAEVSSELDLAILTVRLWFLNGETLIAPYFLDSLSVQLVILFGVHLIVILDIVVAESAWEELMALRALLGAATLVMLAAHLGVKLRHLLLLLLLLLFLAGLSLL